jgi:hypothetical protein
MRASGSVPRNRNRRKARESDRLPPCRALSPEYMPAPDSVINIRSAARAIAATAVYRAAPGPAVVPYPEGETMATLTRALQEIREQLDRIESRLATEDHQVIEIREVSDVDARREIVAFFEAHPGQVNYYGDLSDSLRLPLEQVVRACKQLIDEGVIGIGEHE